MRYETLKDAIPSNVTIKINGHKVETKVYIQYFSDDHPQIGDDFDFGDKIENEKYLARFNSGNDLICINIRVLVCAEGFEGIDDLGGCHVKINEFTIDVLDIVKEYNMIEKASDELSNTILDVTLKLKKYLKSGSKVVGMNR